jgi:hypothetical protein
MEGTQRGARKARLIAVVLLSVALLAVGKATGIADQINVESMRGYVAGAGALGIVVYVAAFAAGSSRWSSRGSLHRAPRRALRRRANPLKISLNPRRGT